MRRLVAFTFSIDNVLTESLLLLCDLSHQVRKLFDRTDESERLVDLHPCSHFTEPRTHSHPAIVAPSVTIPLKMANEFVVVVVVSTSTPTTSPPQRETFTRQGNDVDKRASSLLGMPLPTPVSSSTTTTTSAAASGALDQARPLPHPLPPPPHLPGSLFRLHRDVARSIACVTRERMARS